jgi:hypothetical protein
LQGDSPRKGASQFATAAENVATSASHDAFCGSPSLNRMFRLRCHVLCMGKSLPPRSVWAETTCQS